MKVADIKLTWKRSVSADVERVEVVVNNGGAETTAELGPDVEAFQIEVRARASVSFHVVSYDSEGNASTSESYSFTLGDLEAPQPATLLGHEVLGVRDVEE